MSDLQEKSSSLRMLKPGMKVIFEHVKRPYDQGYIIHITGGDGESPRKKRNLGPRRRKGIHHDIEKDMLRGNSGRGSE